MYLLKIVEKGLKSVGAHYDNILFCFTAFWGSNPLLKVDLYAVRLNIIINSKLIDSKWRFLSYFISWAIMFTIHLEYQFCLVALLFDSKKCFSKVRPRKPFHSISIF